MISISEYRAHFPQNENPVKTAISIGNFDAVHLGHLALIQAARTAVGSDGMVEMWSFNPSPVSVLRPEVHIDRLTTFSHRRQLLLQAGADEVKQIVPTQELLNLQPEEYISQISASDSPSCIVEGEGFRFGHQRTGTIETLRELSEQFKFELIEVKGVEVSLEDRSVVKASSSIVRELLNEGRVSDVQRILGRTYELSGIVVKGNQRGRELGVPTANLGHVETMLPKDGVYAGTASIDDVSFVAAISVGTNPTFGVHERVCEVHLVGFNGEIGLYDWPLTVTISHWVRDQVKFDSVDALTLAIEQDIQTSIKLIESNS